MSESKISRREFLVSSAVGAASVALTGAASLSTSAAVGANDQISVGIIGAGGRAGQLMGDIHRVADSRNVRITAICDTWRPAREKAAKTVKDWWGNDCRLFSNYEDLLALDDVDAVVIATPDFAHSRILIDSVKAGKDAYCEKPMSSTLEDANGVLDAVTQTKRVVQIGTQRRSEGAWKGLVKMVQAGTLGTISRVEIGWNDAGPRWSRGFSDLKAEDVDWKRFLMGHPDRPFDPVQYRRWHFYREFTNGTISLLGSHYIDVASWVMDDPFPTTAVGLGGNYVWKDGREHEDTMYVLFDYPKGFMCRYLSGLGNSAESGMRIYGTNGMFAESTWTFTGTGGSGKTAIKEPIKVVREPNDDHMGNWFDCIRSRATPNASVEAGYRHSIAGILGYQAMMTGKRLKFLPVLRRIVEA